MAAGKYVYVLGAIMGYFAFTAVRIPRKHLKLALALFFLSGLTGAIGELYRVLPSSFNFLFWLFPPDPYAAWNRGEVLRFASAVGISTAAISYMQARYGIRGLS